MDSIFQGQHVHNGVDQPRINAKNIVGSSGGGLTISYSFPGTTYQSYVSNNIPAVILFCNSSTSGKTYTVKWVAVSYSTRDTASATASISILNDTDTYGQDFTYIDLTQTAKYIYKKETSDFYQSAVVAPGQRLGVISANAPNAVQNVNITVYLE